MTEDAAQAMKTRMRDDLRAAMKAGRAQEAKLVRALIAAIDNAEAPLLAAGASASDLHRFDEGSAEVGRLSLNREQVHAVLLAEIRDRERAAAEMDRLARPDHAEALRAQVLLARRYID